MFHFLTFFKDKINGILKDMWINSTDDERNVWKKWQIWDNLRYRRDCKIYEAKQSQATSRHIDANQSQNDEKSVSMKESSEKSQSSFHIPKKKRIIN